MFTQLLASLHFFVKALILVLITTAVIAGIVTLLWNWQIVTLGAQAITFWQAFAVVGIIQFIRIKI